MATYYFKDGDTQLFSDAANWYDDSTFTNAVNIVPDLDVDNVIIGDATSEDSTMAQAVVCYFDDSLTQSAGRLIEIRTNATAYIGDPGGGSFNLVINGTLQVFEDSVLTVATSSNLTTNSTGTFTNNGTFTIDTGCTFVNSGTYQNSNLFYNSGTFNNRAYYVNYGTASNTSLSLMTCSGTNVLTNAGNMTNNSTFIISPGTTINQNAGSILNNATIAFPAGSQIIVTGGSLTNNSPGVISNYTLINIIGGTFNNSASTLNFSAIRTDGGGTYANAGTTVNNGIFSAAPNGYISIRPNSTFTNNNQFIFGSKSNTYFKGDIFPQVPSSAAFGTAILF